MKRIVSLVLILTMLTGMLPMRAFATEDTSETQIIEATVATEATVEPTETEDTETTEEPAEAESTETTAPAEDAEDPILAENTEISQVWALPRKSNVDCIWDFDQDLYARSADGEIQNALQSQALKGNYTLADGYLNAIDLQMALENVIELEADKNWSVEWKYGALNGGLAGFLLCELPGNALGNKGIWHMNNGQIAIADYQDSKGYRNYTSSAVEIKDYDCLRMTNQYNSDTGRSIISLWINDKLVISDFQLKGSMNDYHDKNDMTGYPLSADFAFAYLGNTGASDWYVNCQLDYLKISFGEAEHNHQYTATVTEPTTTAPGFTTYTCSCGDSYVDDYVDAAGKYKRLEALMERGSVSTTYDLGYTSNHYKNYVRSAFDIKTGGAARMSVENRAVPHGEMYVQFFASDYTKISSVKYTNQSVINIPDACDFIRVEIATSQELEKIVIRFYDGTDEPREAKRSGINEVSEKLTYKVSDELHTTSRLMLPPNYSIDGEKVPLILWLEGSGSSFSSWNGDFNSNKLPYLRYLADEGFAVFSVYAWGNQYAEKYPNCGNSFPYPIPTNLACIKEGIAYICDRYNIDADNIHIMSKSQGGQCALYYASCNELNAKTIGMFAPVLDYLSMPGEAMYKDTRAAIADDLDFTGDVAYFASDRFLSYSDEGRAFLRGNLTQLLTLNEAWTNLSGAAPEELFESAMYDCETFWTEQIWKTDRTDIYIHTDYVKTASVPVKIWGAKDDAATPYLKMVEVVQQLKNGGSVAELVTLPNSTGGHSCADIGSTRVNVTTALGIEHKNVPIGWVENVQWIRSNGAADDAHVHTHTPVITAPTCTKQGYTTYTCDCGDTHVDDYVDATGKHTYEDGICSGCGTTVSPYLQQLPENILGCTNLYDSLAPVKGYYTAAKYDTSNGNVLSVVIPVEPGDRIAASSFGSVSENMGSVNGIRVTYLLGDKIVTSLSAGDVYNGYTKNGYITVPEGVDAVCIPWWAPSDSNWLTLGQISKNFAAHSPKPVPAQAPTCTENGYTAGEICEVCNASLGKREEIPPTGHTYSGDTCTICGAVDIGAILDGKYVSILGDSISTFNGYSNDATANTTIGGNGPRYDIGTADTKPGSYCLLESVNDTWWMHFANRSGMNLLVNNSWAGSQVFGSQTSDGRKIPPAYLERCINLHDNTIENNPGNAPINPDVIFVYLGINDYNFNRNNVGNGAVDYAKLVSSDGTYVTPTTFGEAYGILLHKMQNAYPDAQIFAMTLLPENLYSVDKTAWEKHNTYIRAAAECYDIPVIDLAENCAITWENYSGYMIDKIHPTTAGMELISNCIETELVAYYKENRPHTHAYTSTVTAPTCTEQGYTTYTCECGDSYVDDYVDATGHKRTNGSCIVCGDSFAGKKVSILSASTSTYVGVSNNTSYNSTIGKNDVYYTEGRHGVYQKDMWWQQVIDVLDMELLVNNAWSGSCIFQPRKGAASVGYGNRAVNLHNDHTGEEPDIVWVYLGSNDFAYYQDTFGKAADVDYSTLIKDNGDGTYNYAAPTTTCEAYAIMLHKIENRYPGVEIYCMPALARRDPDYAEDNRPDPGQPTAFNAELIAVAEHSGCTVINWEHCIPKEAEFFDQYIGDKRAHPNAAGMDLMSQAVISGMLGKKTELYDIAGTYTNVYTDNNAAAAMEGGDYQAKLTADRGSTLDVTVTMGGVHVTQSVYSNGTIHIENITGDIKITAIAYRAPQEFCWEVVDGTLASTGKNQNTLTALAESISDGVIQEGRYQLETSVILKHDRPWAMEWKCAGDWRGILLSTTSSSRTDGRQYLARTKGGQLCFGIRSGSQSNNYGVDLSKLDAQPHTYRLENRIAADGSNMVWLYLDGIEVGPMNNYFLASKDQGTTSDWINGKDFVFPYIGMDTTPVTNCQLDYLSITECKHTYENGVCTGCGAKLGDLDLSGDIHSDDLTLLACHVARIATLEGQALSNADVNGDGQVNSDDLTRHAQYVARIITSWDQA